MEVWQIDKAILFLVLFVPGFISLKIYDLLIAGERRDFSSSITEAIGYSFINFALLSWLIVLIHIQKFYIYHLFWYSIFLILILFVFPVIWPILFIWIRKRLGRYVAHPIRKPWDWIFGQGKAYWIIVHLKDGRRIGGKFDNKSFASSDPAEEQIYLEEVWKLDSAGGFISPVERSSGIIVLQDEISMIELFH